MSRPLIEGDEIRCWKCASWHVLELGAQGSTAFADRMLFITCGGQKYYAGNVANPPEMPTRPRQE